MILKDFYYGKPKAVIRIDFKKVYVDLWAVKRFIKSNRIRPITSLGNITYYKVNDSSSLIG